MGPDAGTLAFSTADGTYYRLDYTHGDLKLGEFIRAIHDGAFTMVPVPPMVWHQFYLGAGNYFAVHSMILEKLIHDGETAPEQIYRRWQCTLGSALLTKQERYNWLVDKVRSSYPAEGSAAPLTWCDACREEINLWTYWQGWNNLAPEILVVGQDWGCPASEEGQSSLKNITGGDPYLAGNIFPSDINLAHLFYKTFGLDLNHPVPELFFTNMLLGYRTSGNSGSVDIPLSQDPDESAKALQTKLTQHIHHFWLHNIIFTKNDLKDLCDQWIKHYKDGRPVCSWRVPKDSADNFWPRCPLEDSTKKILQTKSDPSELLPTSRFLPQSKNIRHCCRSCALTG